MIEPFVEDYHYQNQCDKPDNISNREWNNRRKNGINFLDMILLLKEHLVL